MLGSAVEMEPITEDGCWVGLTSEVLDAATIMDQVRSPKAGAIVLFAGTAIHVATHCHTYDRPRNDARQL